ncbi:MAG: hypothetical protein U0324_08720 [Polyangiales bacterium]
MSGKQAERARARKAQRRKKQIADRRRDVARRESLPADPAADPETPMLSLLDEDFELGPEDYLPDGQVKASAALLYLAKPFVALTGARTRRAFEMVLNFVMVGWDLAVHPEQKEQWSSHFHEGLKDAPPEVRAQVDTIIEGARLGKLEFFPEDRRTFIGVTVDWSDGYPHVTVASAAPPATR